MATLEKEPARQHEPYIPASQSPREFTFPAVLLGAVLGIIFGASSLYLVLKVGMTVSASIPVAVLSITLFRMMSRLFGLRRATILENNIVQTTGSAGESIAFGVGVTMPAVMLLGYDMSIQSVMTVAVLGGVLGILMMIPLRRAFIVRQHGRLKYPEGTACADVLIVGEEGGSSAKTVFTGFGIAFVYQVLCQVFKLFHETIGWTLTWFKGATPALDLNPALLGVGYIIGTRTASIMVAGGVLAYLVFIPAIRFFGEGLTEPLYPGTQVIGQMSDGDLRNAYVLYIGAGAVAAGGIISLLQALPLIAGSIVAGLRDVRSSGAGGAAASTPRTDRDLSMRVVLLGTLALIVAIWLALPESMGLLVNFAAAVLIVLFGFLFVTVSSRLTGEIGSSSNPISGMTVATLLLTCLIFLSLSWTDPGHRVIALTVAAIVCVASSQGGTTSQDLKTGYLVGGTPRAQQLAIVVGSVSSALVIGWILVALNQAGTVYTREHAPNVRVESIAEAATRDGLPRQTAPDGKSYIVWNAREGNAEEIPPGKYLLSDDGQIQYLVDPAINGQVKERDDGTSVQKFDAPKTRLMALIIDGILNQKLPWDLVLLGVFISLVVELCGIPSLPFAVGVYLPLSASTPIFAGGLVRWIIGRARRWRGEAQGDSDMSPGALLSTGYIAGGAIAGVLYGMAALSETTSQAMTSAGHQVESALHGLQQRLPWFSSSGFSLGNTIGFLGFLGLAGLLIYVSLTQSAAPEIDRGATGKDNPEP